MPESHSSAALLCRRTFLKSSGLGGGALVVGFLLPRAAYAAPLISGLPEFFPNAFVRIARDNSVTVVVKHLDKGQGITTGLATIIAEELDADWAQIKFEFAPAEAGRYGNLFYAGYMATGSSSSIANSWDQLREAGAMARALLVTAVANRWSVPEESVSIDGGILSSGDRLAPFGEFVVEAAHLPLPENVQPKHPSQYRLIGQDKSVLRLDSADKTTGRAIFTIDVRAPGLKVVTVVHPPRFGGVATEVNANIVKSIPGVLDCIIVPTGVAVIAEDTWAAIKGKRAVSAIWNMEGAQNLGSVELMSNFSAMADAPGDVAMQRGDADSLLREPGVVQAEFEFPYLAHAPMEPVNITLAWTPGEKAYLRYGCQGQSGDQLAVATILGLEPANVVIDTIWAGGSFGRRTTTASDFAVEIALIAKATGGLWPLKLQYLREDDMQGGWYRPLTFHRLRARLGPDGLPRAWSDRIVTQSIAKGTAFEALLVKDGIDAMTVEGSADFAYEIPNFKVAVSTPQVGVPVSWWRSVGHTHNAHATEVFIDELASRAKIDPVVYRLALLKTSPRHAAVLELAAKKAQWGLAKLPKGYGRGVAVHQSFGTFVANVLDVVVARDGALRVERVVCAVDCGLAINPDVVRAQMEGAIGFALGAALRGEIVLDNGVVQQTNFDTYQPLRLSEMPKVEVYITPSQERPTGVGEPGVPCVAPALSNAIFMAIGKRVRSLPFAKENLSWA